MSLGNHALAVEIARLPEQFRGYGHVKEGNLAKVKAKWGELMATGARRRRSGKWPEARQSPATTKARNDAGFLFRGLVMPAYFVAPF